VEQNHPADIRKDKKNGYNRYSEPTPGNHGPRPNNHRMEPGPCPHNNLATRSDHPARRATRPHHRTPRGRRNSPITIHRIETHPMTAADEKEAIDALAALLAHHQKAVTRPTMPTRDQRRPAPDITRWNRRSRNRE
jgi:hypothetical protein